MTLHLEPILPSAGDELVGYRRLAACVVAAVLTDDQPLDAKLAFLRSTAGALWCSWLRLSAEQVAASLEAQADQRDGCPRCHEQRRLEHLPAAGLLICLRCGEQWTDQTRQEARC